MTRGPGIAALRSRAGVPAREQRTAAGKGDRKRLANPNRQGAARQGAAFLSGGIFNVVGRSKFDTEGAAE